MYFQILNQLQNSYSSFLLKLNDFYMKKYSLLNSYQVHGVAVTLTHFLMRVLLFTLALAEIVSTMGAAHFTLVMLMLYSKTCINHLKFYRQPKVQEPKVQKPVDQRFRSETQKQLSNKEVNKLIGLSDLDMYVVLMVQFRLVRGYVDTSTAFIMGSGFAMLITLNYVVIMLFGKIPLPLYLVILLLAILCPWFVICELLRRERVMRIR